MKRFVSMGFVIAAALALSESALASALTGPETRANETTANDQQTFSRRSVAADQNGNFVVVWESGTAATQSTLDIYARLFNAQGVALGAQFLVNTTTAGAQLNPAVAMDDDGDFVVVWESADADGFGIFMQRFDETGAKQGGEVQCNTFTSGLQANPRVAMDANGDFALVWQSEGADTSGFGISFRVYNSAGVAQTAETLANVDGQGPSEDYVGDQIHPDIAMDANGNFFIVWVSATSDGVGNGYGIMARKLNAAGAAITIEFPVNATEPGDQEYPTIAMNATGAVIIAWEENGNIVGQRMNSTPGFVGTEFLVNPVFFPALEASAAIDDAGYFAIAYESLMADPGDVYLQRFRSNGNLLGTETRINTTTASSQSLPSLAMAGKGRLIAAWSSLGQDAAGTWGAYFQRLSLTDFSIAAVPVQTAHRHNDIAFNLDATFPNLPIGTPTFAWTKTAGHGVVAFGTPAAQDTTVTLAKALQYTFELAVIDGHSERSERVTVVVDDRYEPNDTSGTAVLLEPDGYQNLYLKPDSEDWFAIEATAGENLVAKVFYRIQDGVPNSAAWAALKANGTVDGPELTKMKIEVFDPGMAAVGTAFNQADQEFGESMQIEGRTWIAAATGTYKVKITTDQPGTGNHYSLLLRRGVPSIVGAHTTNLAIERISPNNSADPNFANLVSQMTFGPEGRLYVTYTGGKIYSFTYDPSGQLTDRKEVADFAGDLVLGLAFHGNVLYVTSNHSVNGDYANSRGRLWRLTDDDADGVFGEAGETKVAIAIFPIGYHHADQIAIHGNTLYVGMGHRTFEAITGNEGEFESSYGGNINWIQDLTQVPSVENAAGFTDPEIDAGAPYTSTAPDKLRTHSTGTRNPFGLCVDGDGQLWMTHNNTGPVPYDGFDEDFTDDHWDEFFKATEFADYGRPNAIWRPPNSMIASNAGFFLPENRVFSVTHHNYFPEEYVRHDPANPIGLGPHCSPDGFAFYMGNTFPHAYHKKVFISRFSAPWECGVTRDILTGFHALRYADIVMVDQETGAVERIAKGFNTPLDVSMDPFGNLLVADYRKYSSGGKHPHDYFEPGIYRIKAAVPASAHDFIWDVDANGTWSEFAKWDPEAVPHQWGLARYNVTIDRAAADPNVALDLDAAIHNLTLQDTLEIPAHRKLTQTGAYTQGASATLHARIAGTGAGQVGCVHVAGQATLSGTLEVTLEAALDPLVDDEFEVLTYGSRSGAFTSLVVNNLPAGKAMVIEYEANRAIVRLNRNPVKDSGPTATPNPTTLQP